MQNPMSLVGKKVLVTGASSGIGRACAILLADLGARVSLTGRRLDALAKTERLMSNHGQHSVYPCDICDPAAVANLVKEVGRLDGLVHSAGVAPMVPIGCVDIASIQAAMSTNYLSFLELMKHYSKSRNRAERMSVVAVSSVSARVGWAGGVAYCGSKGALSASVRALAIELAAKGVRVNAVSPSKVKTPLYEAGAAILNDEEGLRALKAKQPLGLGMPEQVASAVAFLLSDAASFITGVDLPVDGGYLAQ